MTTEVPVHEIRIGERHRKDLGDLESLAGWIRDTGLLHPIGVTPDNVLIFGQRRLRACRDILKWQTIPARTVHVRSIMEGEVAENLVRKDFTPSERVAIVDALRGYTHGGDRKSNQRRNCDVDPLTVEEAAKRVGFCRDDYYRAKKVVERGIPELVGAMDKGKVSLSAAALIADADKGEQARLLSKTNERRWTASKVMKHLGKIRRESAREEAGGKKVPVPPPTDLIRLYHCPFQELEQVAGIAPGSVRLVFTDPPWTKEWLPHWNDLGTFAARVLQEGGLLMCYVPAICLDRVTEMLGRHLRYVYLLTVIHKTRPRQHAVRVLEGCLPILVYSKGEPDLRREIINPVWGGGKQKEWHEWQQSVEEARYLISQTVAEGELVVEPCLGGATTGEAVLRVGGVRFVGCDVDQACVVLGRERLDKATPPA